MKNFNKVAKFAHRLQQFSCQLEKIKDFTVHRHINHFYYMQKKEELIALLEQLEETQRRLSAISDSIEKEYEHTFLQWASDVRWLRTYQMTT